MFFLKIVNFHACRRRYLVINSACYVSGDTKRLTVEKSEVSAFTGKKIILIAILDEFLSQFQIKLFSGSRRLAIG